jgi:hypothetical protein
MKFTGGQMAPSPLNGALSAIVPGKKNDCHVIPWSFERRMSAM